MVPPLPRVPEPGSHGFPHLLAIGDECFSGSEDRRLGSSSPMLAPQQEMRAPERDRRLRETRGSAARARPPVAARVRGRLWPRGREGVGPVVLRLRFPPPRSAGPFGPRKGPRERAGRAGREGRCEVPAPAQRLPVAGARRSSNKFCVSAIHSSHYRCTNQRCPSGPGAGLALKVVPGPGSAGLATDPRYSESRLRRWGCSLGAPDWGGREQRTTAGAGLCPPLPIHTVSNSPPPTAASATCRVGRGRGGGR